MRRSVRGTNYAGEKRGVGAIRRISKVGNGSLFCRGNLEKRLLTRCNFFFPVGKLKIPDPDGCDPRNFGEGKTGREPVTCQLTRM